MWWPFCHVTSPRYTQHPLLQYYFLICWSTVILCHFIRSAFYPALFVIVSLSHILKVLPIFCLIARSSSTQHPLLFYYFLIYWKQLPSALLLGRRNLYQKLALYLIQLNTAGLTINVHPQTWKTVLCYWYEANVAGSCWQRKHVLHDCAHITVPLKNLEKKELYFNSNINFSAYYRLDALRPF